MSKVRKAIIPMAGYGTRFLPYTKAVPKAMLPIINKPTIQIITEEIVDSGITDILFIVGYKKEIILNHFSESKELEEILVGRDEFLESIKYPERMANIQVVEQTSLEGTGKAVYLAKEFVGEEPFAILFGDDVMYNKEPVLKQLIEAYDEKEKTIIGVQRVSLDDIVKYSSIEYSKQEDKKYLISKITEKPKREEVKSNLASIGRYIVDSHIFEGIDSISKNKGEYQLTDALAYVASKYGAYALELDGIKYDMGSNLGYLKANVEFALRDEKLGKEFKDYLKELLKNG